MEITDLLKKMNAEIEKEMPGYTIRKITLSNSQNNDKFLTEDVSPSEDYDSLRKCYEWDEENQVYVEVPCF